jgi:hypothetical protein
MAINLVTGTFASNSNIISPNPPKHMAPNGKNQFHQTESLPETSVAEPTQTCRANINIHNQVHGKSNDMEQTYERIASSVVKTL